MWLFWLDDFYSLESYKFIVILHTAAVNEIYQQKMETWESPKSIEEFQSLTRIKSIILIIESEYDDVDAVA